MEPIGNILNHPHLPKKLSVKEVLESYKHIVLTDEELDDAILTAKQKKEKQLEHDGNIQRVEENRRRLTATTWDVEVAKNFMLQRALKVFPDTNFVLDRHNQAIFLLLCRYFSEDRMFVSEAAALGVDNPSLDKGILLAGDYGTGKTWLMRLFQKNIKCCYLLENTKKIANDFQVDGQEGVDKYTRKRKNAMNDAALFYQPFAGLCIDDMGTEQVKRNYGNTSNVVGDIIELRYDVGDTGRYLHGTTNLSAEGILEFYGGRVTSRMRQIFNIIHLQGSDRRK